MARPTARSISRSADDIVALCVDPDRLEEVWPHIRHYIDAVVGNGRGDDSAEIILNDLHLRLSLLWIAWDGGEIIAAATTKLIKTVNGTVCLITACGGHDMGAERWRKCIAPIESYAMAEGCTRIRIPGRRGWAAIFPDYQQPWIVLEKRLTS